MIKSNGSSISPDHLEARKEILPSGTYHLTTMEHTGPRKALAILESFANLLPLLGAQMWLEEPSRKMWGRQGSPDPRQEQSLMCTFLTHLAPFLLQLSGFPLLLGPVSPFVSSVLLCSPCPVTFPASFVEAQSLLP